MKASEIFAEDVNGQCLIVGDTVTKGKRYYKITDISWDVSGDGFYTETVTLTCLDVKTGKTRFFEDEEVELA